MKTKDKIYTEEFVLNELSLMLDELKDNKDIIYIWELFLDRPYSRSRFHEWVRDYWDKNKDIKRISCTIKEILETRAVTWAMKNKLNATTTIFHLKNNYKWVDKTEVNQNNTNTDISEVLTEEQKKIMAERFIKTENT